MRIVPSTKPATIHFPSGEMVTEGGSSPSASLCFSARVGRSHKRTLRSKLDETSVLPSGDNAAEQMPLPCPCSVPSSGNVVVVAGSSGTGGGGGGTTLASASSSSEESSGHFQRTRRARRPSRVTLSSRRFASRDF